MTSSAADGLSPMETTNLAERYDLAPLDWPSIRRALEAGLSGHAT